VEIFDVMTVVVKTVNYIRSHSQKHRKFKVFLAEIESTYPDGPIIAKFGGSVGVKCYKGCLIFVQS